MESPSLAILRAPVMCYRSHNVVDFLVENTILISAGLFFFFFLPPLHFNLLLVVWAYGNRRPGLFG